MGEPAFSADEAYEMAQKIEDSMAEKHGLVIKAQVHAGGRGRGAFKESGLQGGVHLVENSLRIKDLAPQMINNTLVTKQSGKAGKPCNALYIVEQVKMDRELYIAIMLDRSRACPILICSSIGGMGIEDIDKKYIKTFEINPSEGLTEDAINQAITAFDLPTSALQSQARAVITGLYSAFSQNEATMVEVNPLAILEDGRLLVCDSKVGVDDNAKFRHKELFAMEDLTQKDPAEVEAERFDLNYVKLDGTIGCLVNGAGLAMATMDFVKFKGAEPANFLDVGGGTTIERVYEAVKLINSDPKVESILVNIFGGIVKCDIIVEGLIKAMKEMNIEKPISMRIKGTNSDIAKELAQNSGLPLLWAENVEDAVNQLLK